MRHTEFWGRLEQTLGGGYARVWAGSHVMSSLGGRTVNEALAAGLSPKQVWLAVAEVLEVPVKDR